eukprot:15677_1
MVIPLLLLLFWGSIMTSTEPKTIEFYRYWNGGRSDHFYTTNAGEIGTTTAGQTGKYGYKSEGVVGRLADDDATGPKVVNLYRYWNGGRRDHFYTTNGGEIGTTTAGQTGNHGYKSEGVAGKCFADPNGGDNLVALYRYWNSGKSDHFYTAYADEIGTITPGQTGKYGYKSEGIACYIYNASESASNAPSSSPTLAPSRSPSFVPSIAPTQPPSLAPSLAPSRSPVTSPTECRRNVLFEFDSTIDDKWEPCTEIACGIQTQPQYLTNCALVALDGSLKWEDEYPPEDNRMGTTNDGTIATITEASDTPYFDQVFSVTNDNGLDCVVNVSKARDHGEGLQGKVTLESWSLPIISYYSTQSNEWFYVDQDNTIRIPNYNDEVIILSDDHPKSIDWKSLSFVTLDGIVWVSQASGLGNHFSLRSSESFQYQYYPEPEHQPFTFVIDMKGVIHSPLSVFCLCIAGLLMIGLCGFIGMACTDFITKKSMVEHVKVDYLGGSNPVK